MDVAVPPEVVAEVDRIRGVLSGRVDVVDITGTIADKDRRITTGRVEVVGKVEVTTGRVEIATGLVEVTKMPPIKEVTVTSGKVEVATGVVDTTIIGDTVGLATEATLTTRASETTLSSVDGKLPSLTAAGNQPVAIQEDGVGLAKESTATGIHGILDTRLTKCDTDSVILTTGQVGVLNFPTNYPLPSAQVTDLKTVQVETGQIGVLNFPADYPLPSGQITTLTTTGTTVVTDITGTIADKDRRITTGTVEVATGQIGIISSVGSYWQWNNQSIASGATTDWDFTIGAFKTKTRMVVSNTGDVRVTILLSNDGVNFWSYHTEDVTSGKISTASFTEAFNNMKIRVYGITDAGYNLLVGLQP